METAGGSAGLWKVVENKKHGSGAGWGETRVNSKVNETLGEKSHQSDDSVITSVPWT